jgi:hypothetical protein
MKFLEVVDAQEELMEGGKGDNLHILRILGTLLTYLSMASMMLIHKICSFGVLSAISIESKD